MMFIEGCSRREERTAEPDVLPSGSEERNPAAKERSEMPVKPSAIVSG